MTRRVCVPALLALATACSNSTSGQLIYVPFSMGGVARDAAGPLAFQTPLGWHVELNQVKIALGPFYFNLAQPQTRTLRSGVVIYQVISQVVVDPLDPTLHAVDGGGNGITGIAVAVEIDLLPPDSTQTLEDQSLLNQSSTSFISGVASRPVGGGMQVIPFRGLITINQALVTPSAPLTSLQRVNGAACNGPDAGPDAGLTFTTAPSAVQLRVDPTHWFDTADFSSLLQLPDGGMSVPTADGGPYSWNIQTTFHNEVLNGIQGVQGVYLFNLVDAGE
jgi:hypothetical protein